MRGEFLAEVLGFEEWTNLDFRLFAWHGVRTATHPLHGFVDRFDPPDPIPGDKVLRLSERAIDDFFRAARELDAPARLLG
jgi:hypothetical protein